MNNNKKIAIEWVKAAYDDILTIEQIIEFKHLTHIVAFHSQQAIEKVFKALFEYNQMPFQKTHNLEKLYKQIEHIIKVDYDKLELINELYIDSRYPGDMGLLPNGKPTLDDAKEFYQFAQTIFDEVCEILNVDKKEVT
jgi:HEPN domain-containing protein